MCIVLPYNLISLLISVDGMDVPKEPDSPGQDTEIINEDINAKMKKSEQNSIEDLNSNLLDASSKTPQGLLA